MGNLLSFPGGLDHLLDVNSTTGTDETSQPMLQLMVTIVGSPRNEAFAAGNILMTNLQPFRGLR